MVGKARTAFLSVIRSAAPTTPGKVAQGRVSIVTQMTAISQADSSGAVVGTAGHSESIEKEQVSWEFANLIAGFLDTVSPPNPTPAVAERCL